MTATELCRIMSLKKEFVYQIGSELYVIGACAFRKCTKEEREVYYSFRKQFDELRAATYELVESDCELMNDSLIRLLQMINVEMSDNNLKEARQAKSEFFYTLKEEEISSINEQIDMFIEALDYLDGAFYRHPRP